MNFNLEPVWRDKRGKEIVDYEIRDFYEKISEELLEAHAVACSEHPQAAIFEIRELLDLMTVCATRINVLAAQHHVTDDDLAEMQNHVVECNRERGYFDNDDA